ncbi:unnamed protein product [Rotaria sp. Silwood1]|nr:unnamed protein product [Rotaria sp. Silwood1]CAF0932171.1 unnamed protein product [Rotaria sp. Silwood1]CAF3367257.1 unnamed protein product [Rotaria sp. Silwood1]CAF3414760.1 unnamed protein product [Rotaria sp. Silwood1]CAF4564334.1 unnamed protein product [Rotaria sp. Silwood1]
MSNGIKSCEPHEDEYVEEGITCTERLISPLIDSRYGCTYQECRVNLFETCLPNKNHEHHRVEHLIPKTKTIY